MTKQHSSQGLCLIISGPSGVGKGTVIQALMPKLSDVRLSVSYTTRPPRQGEQDGKTYHFVSDSDFRQMIDQNQFIEWASVHEHLYGTGIDTLEHIRSGQRILFEVDVQGARNLMNACRKASLPLLSFFLMPPSEEVLFERLKKRGTETEQSLDVRISNARTEIAQQEYFDYILINDKIDRIVNEILHLIQGKS